MRRFPTLDGGLLLNDWFCGAGGATQGAHAVPGIVPVLAANHDQMAIDTHSANFPEVEHFRGDIRDLDVARHPYAHIFWASPECTNWSQAKGAPVDFD
jgi:DNA (cytosine-5)-methyltransferase 1